MPDFPSFLKLCWTIGWRSIGGPAAQIDLLYSEFVQKRQLLAHDKFHEALAFCTIIPGPEAQQLATYIGFLSHGLRGAFIAGSLFILPGSLCMALWSALYIAAPEAPLTQFLLALLRPAALGLILAAITKMAARLPKTPLSFLIASFSGAILALSSIPFPVIVLIAGLLGFLQTTPTSDPNPDPVPRPKLLPSLQTAMVGLTLWLVPIGLVLILLGPLHPLSQLGIFLTKASTTTFGGAYATLPYIAKAAVEQHGWFTQSAMLDGLALGETTPGPLLLVLQFYGFLTGWNSPAPLSPVLAAALGSVIALWTTFAPSFFWIITGSPWARFLSQLPRLKNGLRMISIALVGSLAFLGWTLSQSTLWSVSGPVWSSFAITTAVFCLRIFAAQKPASSPK